MKLEPQPVIMLENIKKTYRMGLHRLNALKGVSLRIDRGETVAVMGSSGSGKSTLLNIIGCLDRPTEGSYFLEGTDVSKMSRDDLALIRNEKIGFIFQGFNLLSRTSALENVILPLWYTGQQNGAGKREMERRGLEALSWVGLADHSRHHPNQLSGGQQQRVAIARALINNPSLLLADEPTGALDTRTGIEVVGIIQRLNRDKNITVVIVTHDPGIAEYCGRIVRLRDGRILGDEKVPQPKVASEELKRMPAEVEA
ncbi:MAG: ABC transporter ATP-binding protein [Bacillota bacterium]